MTKEMPKKDTLIIPNIPKDQTKQESGTTHNIKSPDDPKHNIKNSDEPKSIIPEEQSKP